MCPLGRGQPLQVLVCFSGAVKQWSTGEFLEEMFLCLRYGRDRLRKVGVDCDLSSFPLTNSDPASSCPFLSSGNFVCTPGGLTPSGHQVMLALEAQTGLLNLVLSSVCQI